MLIQDIPADMKTTHSITDYGTLDLKQYTTVSPQVLPDNTSFLSIQWVMTPGALSEVITLGNLDT